MNLIELEIVKLDHGCLEGAWLHRARQVLNHSLQQHARKERLCIVLLRVVVYSEHEETGLDIFSSDC